MLRHRKGTGRVALVSTDLDAQLVKNKGYRTNTHTQDKCGGSDASASSRHTRGRNNQSIGANTVRKHLSTSGLRARRPYIGPILTQRHGHQRMLWAQEHAAWDRIQWRNVVPRYSVTNLDSALTMLMAVYVYGEEAVKDTKQIALGNTKGGAEHLSMMCCYTGSPRGAHTLLAAACLDL
ncbi:transposable element Tc1 transposase [Elysia marginata]|uniref:Transposable element Tc1 transposase n=1 Tax=Elysia marginata TaxID=1093978 RepID=A0AAV4ESK2_9GAST|nr:transposable element Tc1 transposase [Elysia marginata]